MTRPKCRGGADLRVGHRDRVRAWLRGWVLRDSTWGRVGAGHDGSTEWDWGAGGQSGFHAAIFNVLGT